MRVIATRGMQSPALTRLRRSLRHETSHDFDALHPAWRCCDRTDSAAPHERVVALLWWQGDRGRRRRVNALCVAEGVVRFGAGRMANPIVRAGWAGVAEIARELPRRFAAGDAGESARGG